MKRLTYLFTGLFIVFLVASCSKEAADDNGVILKVATISKQSLPVSVGGITPVILAVDKPKGGNVTCSDVAQAYFTSFEYCGDKLDYGDFDKDGDKEFSGSFPLNVTVEGSFVSFSTEGGNCIQINDKYYKVGAVIVKGGNAANVYFYPNGTFNDSGLASPINASGRPAGLSNLTFCFFECEQEELIIAVKVFYKEAGGNSIYWGVSTGTNIFTGGTWCAEGSLGVNSYPATSYIPIEKARTNEVIGGASVVNSIVTITLNEGLVLDKGYVFIGTQEELVDPDNMLSGCPDYENAPWIVYQ